MLEKKQIIKNLILLSENDFSIDDILVKCSEHIPDTREQPEYVKWSTVFRILDELTEQGIVRFLNTGYWRVVK